MEKDKALEIILKTNEDNLLVLDNFIERVANYFNIGDKYFANILMVVRETFEKIIENTTQTKIVKITFRPNVNGLICNVLCDSSPLTTKVFEEKLSPVFLLSDDVKFLNDSEVEISFVIEGIHPDKALKRSNEMLQYFENQKVVNKT